MRALLLQLVEGLLPRCCQHPMMKKRPKSLDLEQRLPGVVVTAAVPPVNPLDRGGRIIVACRVTRQRDNGIWVIELYMYGPKGRRQS